MTTQPTTKPSIQIAREARTTRSKEYSQSRLIGTRRAVLILSVLKQKLFWASTLEIQEAINRLMIESWSVRTVIRDLHLLGELQIVEYRRQIHSGGKGLVWEWRFVGLESPDFMAQWDGEEN